MTVFLLLLGQIASIGHYVFVTHYVCAVHGTLHHGRPPVVKAPRQESSAPAVSDDRRTDHDSHDECAFPAREQQRVATLSSVAVEPLAPSAELTAISLDVADVGRNIPLLALAPKQSPPERI